MKTIITLFSIILFNNNVFAETELYNSIDLLAKKGNFSGTLGVIKDNQTVILKSYGLSNTKQDILNHNNTRYIIASITKQFTAAGIMILKERNMLSLDGSICNYLTRCPKHWEPISIHNLLTHTSGLTNYTDLPSFYTIVGNFQIKLDEIIDTFIKLPLISMPNLKYKYGNSTYLLLAKIIEDVTGEKFQDFIINNIFIPLNMNKSSFNWHDISIGDRAYGYTLNEDNAIIEAEIVNLNVVMGAASIVMPITDYLKWDKALYSNEILSKESINQIFTPFLESYGYGWRIGVLLNNKVFRHGGEVPGFTSYVARFPESKSTIVIFSNHRHFKSNMLAYEISKLILKR